MTTKYRRDIEVKKESKTTSEKGEKEGKTKRKKGYREEGPMPMERYRRPGKGEQYCASPPERHSQGPLVGHPSVSLQLTAFV